MGKPISDLYNPLYELTRKLTHLKPAGSSPLRFTAFCPIHGFEKTSDVAYWMESKDSTEIKIRCKKCGDLSIEDILNPKLKPVAVITDSLALIEEFNFDYSGIDAADEIKAATSRIKARWKRVGEDLIEVGKELNAVKDRLPHGQFLPWLKAEFELSQRTANDLMNVATRFEGKSANIADLNSTVLYLLAAPSTPDEVVDLAMETAAKGETVSVAKVKTWKQASDKIGKVKPTAKPKQAEPVKPAPVETATPVNQELENFDNSNDQAEPVNELDEKHLAFDGKQSMIHQYLDQLLNSTCVGANNTQVQILKKHLDWNLFASKYDHNLADSIRILNDLLKNLPAIIEILEDAE